MKIKVNNNPTYALELSQEELLVIYGAIGDRTGKQWEEYRNYHKLTDKQREHLQQIASTIYDNIASSITNVANSNSDGFFIADDWLVQQYKESYKE